MKKFIKDNAVFFGVTGIGISIIITALLIKPQDYRTMIMGIGGLFTILAVAPAANVLSKINKEDNQK